jgi:high frequency lysogenization protein
MPQTDHDRVIALAGLFQAASLVSNMAHYGKADPGSLEVCLASLFRIDAESSEAVYGGFANLRLGLTVLSEHLVRPKDMEITRYVVALLVLERKLTRQSRLLQKIRRDIEICSAKAHHFPITHDSVLTSLAELYTATVSTLKPRIRVNGKPEYLTVSDNANRIRAVLLAGIRAATLWRQSGGSRLTLLFRRRALLQEAQRMLALPET